ncbi:hypothetical protein KIPB_008898, partial [Kipferlia bialata]|eukprot:g8898.t1
MLGPDSSISLPPSDSCLTALAEALPHMETVAKLSLDFQGHPLSNHTASILAQAMERMIGLNTICMDYSLEVDSLATLFQCMQPLPRVTEVQFNVRTLMNGEICLLLASLIKRGLFPNMNKLDLRPMPHGDAYLTAYADALPCLQSLTELRMGSCQCRAGPEQCVCASGADALDLLIQALPRMKSLSWLDLSGQCVCNASGPSLCKHLPRLKRLATLFLSCGSVSRECMEAICSGMRLMQSLQMLCIGFTDLTLNRWEPLFDVLPCMWGLKRVSFLSCKGADDWAAPILEALAAFVCLDEVSLQANNISTLAMRRLVLPLANMPGLKELNLSINPIGDEGLMYLANVLQSLKGLELLNLCHCGIPEVSEAACTLAMTLIRRPNIVEVSLSGNSLREEFMGHVTTFASMGPARMELSRQILRGVPPAERLLNAGVTRFTSQLKPDLVALQEYKQAEKRRNRNKAQRKRRKERERERERASQLEGTAIPTTAGMCTGLRLLTRFAYNRRERQGEGCECVVHLPLDSTPHHPGGRLRHADGHWLHPTPLPICTGRVSLLKDTLTRRLRDAVAEEATAREDRDRVVEAEAVGVRIMQMRQRQGELMVRELETKRQQLRAMASPKKDAEQALLGSQKFPNRLMVDDAPEGDNSAVYIHPDKLEELDIFSSDYVVLKGRVRHETCACAIADAGTEPHKIKMNRVI